MNSNTEPIKKRKEISLPVLQPFVAGSSGIPASVPDSTPVWEVPIGPEPTLKKVVYNEICIYTDGSCLGNPGPGGFCALIVQKVCYILHLPL